MKPGKAEVKPGDKYELLKVIQEVEARRCSRGTKRMVLVECVCGTRKTVQLGNILSGNSRSCGKFNCPGAAKKQARAAARSRPDTNRNMCYASYRHHARKRGLVFELTIEEFRELTQSDCLYCGQPPSNVYCLKHKNGKPRCGAAYIYGGIDRLDSKEGYRTGNVVPCCRQCNVAKNTLTQVNFADWVRRVVARMDNWAK